ncbi:MAG: AsmA family protein [Rhodospirillales bacterium]|nr:AsmA family protein [Rhodospirillales bacterium]
MRRGLRQISWVIGSLLALLVAIPLVAIAVFALFFEWNDARPLLARLASGLLGRTVTISGDLDVDLGRVTSIEVQGLALANTPWGRADQMLRVGDLAVSVALRPLLSGDVVIPSLAVKDVQANLERNERGQGNWEFGRKDDKDDSAAKPAATDDGTINLPLVQSLHVEKVRVDFHDRFAKKNTVLIVDSLEGGEDQQRRQMAFDGSGSYQGRPAKFKATLGSLTVLEADKQPYPLNVALSAGDIRMRIDGTIAEPRALQGLNLQLEIAGNDLSDLFPLTGIPIPPSPPYQLSGRLERKGGAWVFKGFAGKLGDSDMRGDVAIDLGRQRPQIRGDVVSKLLDLKDLAGFIGASEGGPDAKIEARPGGKILPDKEIDLSKLRAVDADISFKGTRIVTPKVPIDTLEAKVSLDDGTFRVQPATFAIGKGNVRLFFSLYGGEQPVRSDIEAVIEHVDLRRLLQGSEFVRETAGSFNGRIKLSSTGTSVADIAGSANGDVMVVMTDGRFSRLLVELMGLDIVESLGILIEGDESIPVRCIVADLGAKQGIFNARTLVFDTTDTNVVGSGTINMREERLDLRLSPYPKDFSPFTLRTPISVQGTLAQPDAFPDPADIGVEGGLKKVLNAALTVVTGLLPPIDVGPGKDAPCAELIGKARQRLGDRRG